MGQQFIAIVGAYGAGKSKLREDLENILPPDKYVFLSDSRGRDKEVLLINQKIIELTRARAHENMIPVAQLMFFWARLSDIIERYIVPALKQGKVVVIDGFGGTILAHVLYQARSIEEREHLIQFHKLMIQNLVVGLGVPPPKYLWLCVSPQVAHDRLLAQGRVFESEDLLERIAQINQGFQFYGTLEGQTVVKIDGDLTSAKVLEEVLKHFEQEDTTGRMRA